MSRTRFEVIKLRGESERGVYEGQARRDEPSVARNSESDSWLKQKRSETVRLGFRRGGDCVRRLSLGLFCSTSSRSPTTTRSES